MAFELRRVGEGGDADFGGRRSAFMAKLEIPEGESAEGFEIGAARAGQKYDLNGRIDAMSPANRRIRNVPDACLRDEVARLEADGDRWEWMLTKYQLQQLDRGLDRGAPPGIAEGGLESHAPA